MWSLLWQFLSNKHHHWVRDNWVQIIVIKVFILLQERSSSPIHMSESVRRDKESSASLFYSSLLQGLLSSLPYRERYQFVYLLMVMQKREANAPLTPWPSAFLYLSHRKSHKECFSNYKWENIWCIHLESMFHCLINTPKEKFLHKPFCVVWNGAFFTIFEILL